MIFPKINSCGVRRRVGRILGYDGATLRNRASRKAFACEVPGRGVT